MSKIMNTEMKNTESEWTRFCGRNDLYTMKSEGRQYTLFYNPQNKGYWLGAGDGCSKSASIHFYKGGRLQVS